jgi:NAD+ synthase (glutamine-hydrolysing)
MITIRTDWEVIRANVLKYHLPIVYCNAIGSQTEIVFDGGSLAFDQQGNVISELKYFEEDLQVVDMGSKSWPVAESEKNNGGSYWPADLHKTTPPHGDTSTLFDKDMRVSKISDPEKIIEYLTSEENIVQIHHALVLGIRDYFQEDGVQAGYTWKQRRCRQRYNPGIGMRSAGSRKRSRCIDAVHFFYFTFRC